MPLSAGTTIGSYEVTAQIGAGGMGEVYRATATKLNRDVALKVLPEAFTSNPERLVRFEREAKVLASLNHPNIGHIYGLQEAEGTKALVLELVKGPTLTDRIAKAPVPIEEALTIARQIAEALEAAHEQGIIHRDLKPANVKIRDDGAVKVLDFGLAKVFQAEPEGAESQSPTLTATATLPGVIMGTAAYMSPEQAKGEPIDKRSDIWAFGCVLYEMLTGRRTFGGDSVSEIMAGVIKGEPDWDALPAELSPGLVTLIRRSLQKNPKERIRDIGDVRLRMADASDVPVAPDSELRVWQRLLPAAIVAPLVAIVSGLAVWGLLADRTTEPSATTTRWSITLPESYEFSSRGGSVALSPDGQTLVYSAIGDGGAQLFRRPINQFEALPMTDTAGGGGPFFSPDGQWVGFLVDGGLRKVALAGGPSQKLTESRGFRDRQGAVWTSDDMIVLGGFASLAQVPAAGGEPRVIVEPEGDGRPWYPHVLPGRGAILFTLLDLDWGAGELQILLPETGERRKVLPNAVAGRVLDTGHLVFVRSGALWAVPFDQKRFEIVGTPVPVVEGVYVYVRSAVQYAVSENGTLVYFPGDVGGADRKTTLTLVDRQGTSEKLPLPSGDYARPRFSPDGTRIAVQIDAEDGSNIFLYELSNNRLRQLTFDGGEMPLWTPDGTQITFRTKKALWNIASDYSGETQRLSRANVELGIVGIDSWSPDGRVLLFGRRSAGAGFNSVMQLTRPEDGGVEYGPVLVEQTYAYGWVNFSADGQWFAFATNETGAAEVYIQPYPPGTGAKRRITHGGGTKLVWSRNGRELFYVNDGQLWAMGIQTEPTLDWHDPVALFEVPWMRSIPGLSYDVTPDGQRFVFVQPPAGESDDPPRQIHVVLNWFEELKERVPVPSSGNRMRIPD